MDLKYKLLIGAGAISTATVACAVPAALVKSSTPSTKKNYTPLSDMQGFKDLNLDSNTFGGKYKDQLLGMDDPKPTSPQTQMLNYTTNTNKEIGESKFEQLKKTKPELQLEHISKIISVCLKILQLPASQVENATNDHMSLCLYS